MDKSKFIGNCRVILEAYKFGKLGQTKMPEDSNPGFSDEDIELRLAYFTLPMALNYQRDSYKLWESALKTYNDEETRVVFDVSRVSKLDEEVLREYLTRYKIALQPNKQTVIWRTIAQTVFDNFGSFEKLMENNNQDCLKLKETIQIKFKIGFPYLSGPKIFNYWLFIMREYGNISLKNSEFIEIAPDTHVTQSSVLLGLISEEESKSILKEKLSQLWRDALKGSNINPIDMHSPLWFWSRNGFLVKLDNN